MKKLIVLCFLIGACGSRKTKVDLIVFNAQVYTVDKNFTTTEAFAVKDGRFLAIGTTDEILGTYTAEKQVDAEKKTITPGFIDAHCHFYGLGLNQQVVDLVGTKSFEEVLQKLQQFEREEKPNFIVGRGWDQNDWEVKTFPTREKLDALFPDIPVAIKRVDGHAYLVNQRALNLASIDLKTVAKGGEIEKKEGKLTGILIDGPMERIDSILPLPDRKMQMKALMDAQAICLKNGLTTVDDAGLDKAVIQLIDSVQKSGDLKIRVYAMLSNKPENLDYYLPKGIVKTKRLHVRSVKVYGDGALGSRGATLKEAYSDRPGHYGAMVTPVDQINELANRIARSEYQMNTHAIGDSANVVVLRAYEKALEGKHGRRWRIEHAQVVAPEDFQYFSKGTLPSVQPTHATSDMYWAEDRVGAHRIHGAYACQTLLKQAGRIALGTDFPVEKVNPVLTFYAATSRQDLDGYPENGFLPGEKLSREDALKGMTIWAAYANFEELEKGSIEIGKLADFVVLSADIMEQEEAQLPEIQVLATYIDGEKVY